MHQSRPCLRAKVSAVKLEAIGPVEKRQGIGCVAFGACDMHSSITGIKKGGDRFVSPYLDVRRGREDSLLEADWSRAVLLPVQSGMKRETVKWIAVHGGKGGT